MQLFKTTAMKRIIISIIGFIVTIIAALIVTGAFKSHKSLEVLVKKNSTDKPIPEALVTLEKDVLRTGDDGIVVFDQVKKGYKKIQVQKNNFETYNGTINITAKNNVSTIYLTLKKDTITISGMIASPKDNVRVISPVSVSGKVENLTGNDHLWLVVHPHGTNGWWPQTSEIIPKHNRNWTGTIRLGGINNKGQKFDIHLVIADNKANDSFNQYLSKGAENNNYPEAPLPEGAKSLDYVTVIKD